jgi:predicted choloylglycine hydrolase
MCYTVTLLDAKADWATVFVAPDRPTEVTRRKSVTNFQHQVEWPKHAEATHAVERQECLSALIDGGSPLPAATAALLQPPLFQAAYLRGYGTLYSAVYRPHSISVELLWPGQRWAQSLASFSAGERTIVFEPASAA